MKIVTCVFVDLSQKMKIEVSRLSSS